MKVAVGSLGSLAQKIFHQLRKSLAVKQAKWKQIGVKEIADTREFPFFIQWLSADHPSQDGTPLAEIEKIVIADKDRLADSWFKDEILASLGDVNIEWVDPATNDDQSGIVALHLTTPGGVVVLD
jgi:hypothetical protein